MNKKLEKIMKEEGNYMKFEVLKMPCVIRRIETGGHWCGYVGVKKDSRLYGKSYNYWSESGMKLSKLEQAINDIKVHGGLTYSGFREGRIDTWYFGFDCAHAGDLIPFYFFDSSDVYRNKEYVIEECKRLAIQLTEIIELGL